MERLKGESGGGSVQRAAAGEPSGKCVFEWRAYRWGGTGIQEKGRSDFQQSWGLLHGPLPNFFPEFSRRWCVLSDGVLSYYENERAVTPNGEIRAGEIVCLAVSPLDTHG